MPTPPGGPATAKPALRERMLAARGALAASWRAEASAAICARAAALPELQGAATVLGYAAVRSEVDLDPLLRALLAGGARVVLPWVDGPRLGLAAVADLDRDLAAGSRGVREPRPATRASAHAVRTAADIDAAVVPGLAFDAAGARLGYGGGHFDRLLARLRPDATVVGVAFELQIVAAVPIEIHDRLVDAVVTEQRVLRVPRV